MGKGLSIAYINNHLYVLADCYPFGMIDYDGAIVSRLPETIPLHFEIYFSTFQKVFGAVEVSYRYFQAKLIRDKDIYDTAEYTLKVQARHMTPAELRKYSLKELPKVYKLDEVITRW